MAGYDDARFLQAKIEKLEREVEQLKRSTLPLTAQQVGPISGWFRAGQVGQGPGVKSSMHAKFDGNKAGDAPRISVTDANGITRVELGNLAAYTGPSNGSNAQYGLRLIDTIGNVQLDSFSFTNIAKYSSSNSTTISTSAISTWSTVNAATFTAISGSSLTVVNPVTGGAFTHGGQLMIIATIAGKVSAGTGSAYAAPYVNGAVTLGLTSAAWASDSTEFINQTCLAFYNFGAVASLSIQFYGSTSANTVTGAYSGAGFDAFFLGALPY